MKKETAKKDLEKLINDYEIHRVQYAQKNYDEHQFCTQVLNRFFKILGWDVENVANHSEYYCEIILQYRLKGKNSTTFPDYAFGFPAKTNPKFFVEAKTPATIIKQDKDAAHQTRRYGNSATLAISVLTNFEEFSIYDCSRKPKESDAAKFNRLEHFTYNQYLDKFDFLWNTFSTEGIKQGFFDKYVQTDTKKKGSAPLDKEFVETLDNWRKLLADDIAGNNLKLDDEEINTAVQQTIDRIIFLRFCEDRGTEKFGTLQETISKGEYYKNLFVHFKQADEKYNSGLFDFDKDKISFKLKIDNKVIKKIISALYRPNNDYEFGVMPVEVLGNAYEEFLGKVIHITPGHKAKINIDKKPEVQKAGGVFYTPQYIVNYIVENTLGKLLKGKTPEQISKIRVLDPACGSGSFLLGAYVHLLRYHTDYYWKKDYHKKKVKANPLTPNGQLTVTEKKKILTNNIYGVDIDANAVEVTKLSLLLKAMEGETEASVAHQLQLFKKGILPDLDQNIQCGNSLVEPDFDDGKIGFDKKNDKIKPFNWKSAFPKVFENGGFDLVIGNPPWGAELKQDELEYLKLKHNQIVVRMIDSFMYFVHKGYLLSKSAGYFGMILPDVLFYQIDNFRLREFILKNCRINVINNLGNVFVNVVRPSCILIFTKNKSSGLNSIEGIDIAQLRDKQNSINDKSNSITIKQKTLLQIPKFLFITKNPDHYLLLRKITASGTNPLATYIDEDGIQRGVSPDYKDAFIVGSDTIKKYKLEKGKLKRVLTGGTQVKRYNIQYPDLWVIYTTREDDFKKVPNICKYIDLHKNEITCKEVKQNKHPIYALHRPREEKIFLKSDKIVGVITEDEIVVALDEQKYYCSDGLYLFDVKDIDRRYIMALLNSSLFIYIYRLLSLENGRTLAQVKPTILNDLPIRIIRTEGQQKEYEKIIHLAGQLINLYKANVKNQKLIQHRIDYIKEEINSKVYELYGLNKKDIEIIKKAIK